MTRMPEAWDYLILTASNDRQAQAYASLLKLRRDTGRLARVRQTLVVADIEGRRIGSGGSTLECLLAVLNREASARAIDLGREGATEEILRRLRILIVHAGGDSRRLPAYGPCGKIFLPVPGESEGALSETLFDRLVPTFLGLEPADAGEGQVVVTSGDALILLDAEAIRFSGRGLIAVGCEAAPEEAARHGVFCRGEGDRIRLYLQKPSVVEQRCLGALDRYGKALLDAGVMSFDASACATLLGAFDACVDARGQLSWPPAVRHALLTRGVDLYREICCALGTEASVEHFVRSARASGSIWDEAGLAALFPRLHAIPFRIQALPQCSFLHFGSTRQLIPSGITLATQSHELASGMTCLSVNNDVSAGGSIAGSDAWVESCHISAPLSLSGHNVVVGLDIDAPLSLGRGAAIDVLSGLDRAGAAVWFVRCYGVDDDFKTPAERGGLFCGRPLAEWIAAALCSADDIWDASIPESERSLWNARVFPAEATADYRRWLWIHSIDDASAEQKQTFRTSDRYSAEEVALLADQDAFHIRRARMRAARVHSSLSHAFRRESSFSAADLAFTLAHSTAPASSVSAVLTLACEHLGAGPTAGLDSLVPCRILHALGSAVDQLAHDDAQPLAGLLPDLRASLPRSVRDWMQTSPIRLEPDQGARAWAARLRALAFDHLNSAILASSLGAGERPRNALRPDETIWGRGPARIELGGGWTDTPPYTLEHGGDVANVAVNLNGQPPIHCYCRMVEEPVIRLSSIDGGTRMEIRTLDELVDYRRPGDRFALSKAALAISGFSREAADWPSAYTLEDMLRAFGGGIELTTLVGIPKGSGLGTSSILGAVILAVVNRLMGRPSDQRALFHDVLRLEQALTTGGGWQDQAGGGVGGAKVTSTRPGMVPTPRIHYVPSDLVDPRRNGGSTLLYYTGMTRIAKNILQQIVGGYLDRDGRIMAALEEEHLVAHNVADALSLKDAAGFGRSVNAAWELQKRLCGTVTNETIEQLLDTVRPYVHGMRISGAGSGGFLLMIAKSGRDAARIRELLEARPLNDRARFFDYEINDAGLEVTTC